MNNIVFVFFCIMFFYGCSTNEAYVKDKTFVPKLMSKGKQLYPVDAYQSKLNGIVVVSFDIQCDGSTGNIEILKAEPLLIFDDAAKYYVSQLVYEPIKACRQYKESSVLNKTHKVVFEID